MRTALFLGALLTLWTPLRAEIIAIEDLLDHLHGYAERHPHDARSHAALARVHALLITHDLTSIRVSGPLDPASLPTLDPEPPSGRTAPPRPDLAAAHARSAVTHYSKALELDGAQGGYHLGYAQALERGSPLAGKVDLLPRHLSRTEGLDERTEKQVEAWVTDLADDAKRPDARRKLREHLHWAAPLLHAHRGSNDTGVREAIAGLLAEHWREEAIRGYLWAHNKSIDQDLNRPRRSLEELVSYSAGQGYLRLVRQRGVREAEVATVERIERRLQALRHGLAPG